MLQQLALDMKLCDVPTRLGELSHLDCHIPFVKDKTSINLCLTVTTTDATFVAEVPRARPRLAGAISRHYTRSTWKYLHWLKPARTSAFTFCKTVHCGFIRIWITGMVTSHWHSDRFLMNAALINSSCAGHFVLRGGSSVPTELETWLARYARLPVHNSLLRYLI